MKDIKHTELPIRIEGTRVLDAKGRLLFVTDWRNPFDGNMPAGEEYSIEQSIRNERIIEPRFDFIVRAVNSHYELVRLLKEALPRICQDLPKPMDAGTHEYLSILENEIQNAIKQAEATL